MRHVDHRRKNPVGAVDKVNMVPILPPESPVSLGTRKNSVAELNEGAAENATPFPE